VHYLDMLVSHMKHLAKKHGLPEVGVILYCHRVCPLATSCSYRACFYHGPRLKGDYPWPFLGLKEFSMSDLVHEFGHYRAHRWCGWHPYGSRPHDEDLCEELAVRFAKSEGFDAMKAEARQELVLAGTKVVTIWKDQTIWVEWWKTSAEIKEGVNIKWDPEKTRITKAELYVKGCLPYDGTCLSVYVNDREQYRYERYWPWQPECTESRVDVTHLLINGWNEFKAVTWKWAPLPGYYEAIVTAILTITFEGIEPRAELERELKERWFKTAFWLVTFAALGVVGVTIYKELKKP